MNTNGWKYFHVAISKGVPSNCVLHPKLHPPIPYTHCFWHLHHHHHHNHKTNWSISWPCKNSNPNKQISILQREMFQQIVFSSSDGIFEELLLITKYKHKLKIQIQIRFKDKMIWGCTFYIFEELLLVAKYKSKESREIQIQNTNMFKSSDDREVVLFTYLKSCHQSCGPINCFEGPIIWAHIIQTIFLNIRKTFQSISIIYLLCYRWW